MSRSVLFPFEVLLKIFAKDLCKRSLQKIFAKDLCKRSLQEIFAKDLFFFELTVTDITVQYSPIDDLGRASNIPAPMPVPTHRTAQRAITRAATRARESPLAFDR